MTVPTKRLGDLLLEAKPGFACGEEAEDGIFQIRMNNITRDGRLDLSKRRLVPAQRPGIAGFLLREGDVLFNATNSPDMVGKTALIYATDEPTVFSNHFLRLRVDRSTLLPAYLARWLHLQFDGGIFKAMCRQWVNQATVGRDTLLRLAVPLPSLAEQRRVAEVLDRADELRAKRREALNTLDDLTQSIFLDMFGDPVENERRWPTGSVRDFVARFESGKNLVAEDEDDPRAQFRVLKVSAVTSLTFIATESKAVPSGYIPPQSHVVRDGDLLFSRANTEALVGATAMVTDPPHNLLLPDKLWRFVWHEPVRSAPLYVRQLFQQPSFRREISRRATGTSGSMKNISQDKVLSITTGIPPLTLQHSFAHRVAKVELLKAAHRASLAELDALFASLQDRAFRGLL
ncbi:restriction endonuclease subunit S [Micromonospora sp. WMMD558]|uniref:restriction endonuclease subunit S n=1 Tax=unclassified Micromonospora TaxID=2617518 RepID=UPI0018AFAF4C|nr:restriction endonuclease subunit S [Micromonospora sp. WMMC415]